MPKDVSALLERLTDETQRNAMKSILETHPEIADQFLAQEEFSRKMNSLQSERAALEELASRGRQWDAWYEHNFPGIDPNQLPAQFRANAVSPAVAVAAAAGSSPTDETIDFDNPAEAVQKIKQSLIRELGSQFVQRDALDADLRERMALAQRTQEQRLGTTVALHDRIVELRGKYERDFGEAPPEGFAEKIYAVISQHGYRDPSDAYSRLMQEKYAQKAQSELDAKIKEAQESGYKKRQLEEQTLNVPGGDGPSLAASVSLTAADTRPDPYDATVKAGHALGDGFYSKTALGPMLEEDLRAGRFSSAR